MVSLCNLHVTAKWTVCFQSFISLLPSDVLLKNKVQKPSDHTYQSTNRQTTDCTITAFCIQYINMLMYLVFIHIMWKISADFLNYSFTHTRPISSLTAGHVSPAGVK